MRFPESFLEELRARTTLPALIGGCTQLRRDGRNWKGCCPFHHEKTPSFYVYEDHYHCFGCGAHGDAMAFVMWADRVEFPAAVERLAAAAGLALPEASPRAEAQARQVQGLHAVLAAAAAVFQRRLHAPGGAAALAYLRGRGLTDATIAAFGLGWSGDGRGALAAELAQEGITPAQLVDAGLLKPRDDAPGFSEFFFNRVIFPIRDRRGRVVSFGGRAMGDAQPKYLNGPETAVFQKRRMLFAEDVARPAVQRGAALVVVEGYMDAIALHQAGFAGAVAPLGTAVTEDQLHRLWAMSPEPVLAFDGDAAGTRASLRAAELALPLLEPDRSLRIASIPAGTDPDSLLQAAGSAALGAVLSAALPLSAALYGLLVAGRSTETPEQRAALRGRLEAAAGTIRHRALAAEYRRALLERFFGPRPGRPAAPALLRRPLIDAEAVARERGRNLLAILLHHPAMAEDQAELLSGLPLADARLRLVREALLEDGPPLLDRASLPAPLAAAVDWVQRPAGLCEAARHGRSPAEAAAAWSHFLGLLATETALRAEAAAQVKALVAGVATAGPALRAIAEAQLALRQMGA